MPGPIAQEQLRQQLPINELIFLLLVGEKQILNMVEKVKRHK